MREITFPLNDAMRGDAVADLQAALQLLVDKGVVRGILLIGNLAPLADWPGF